MCHIDRLAEPKRQRIHVAALLCHSRREGLPFRHRRGQGRALGSHRLRTEQLRRPPATIVLGALTAE